MNRIIFFLTIIFITVNMTTQTGWSEKVKPIHIKFTEEYVIGNSDIDEQLLQYPNNIKLHGENIYVLDKKGCSVKKYDKNGRFLLSFGNRGYGPQEVVSPVGFAIRDKEIYISNSGNSRIEIFYLDGSYKGSIKLNQEPGEIFTDSHGNLLINFSWRNFLVHKYSKDGKLLESFVPASNVKDMMIRMFYNMITMTMGDNDELYVVYRFQNKIEKYNSSGNKVFSTQRPLVFEYPELKSVNSGTGTSLNAIALSLSAAYNNKVLYVLTWQGKKKGEEIDTLCDVIDSKGSYIYSFKIPYPANFIQFDGKDTIYIINSYESTIHKCKMSIPGKNP